MTKKPFLKSRSWRRRMQAHRTPGPDLAREAKNTFYKARLASAKRYWLFVGFFGPRLHRRRRFCAKNSFENSCFSYGKLGLFSARPMKVIGHAPMLPKKLNSNVAFTSFAHRSLIREINQKSPCSIFSAF